MIQMNFAKAFPHVRVGSEEYRAIISKLKDYVQLELGGLSKHGIGWLCGRNLATMPSNNRIDLTREVRSRIEQNPGRSVKIFEVGCGKGHTLRTLKTLFGDSVHVDGITLTRKAADYAAGKFDAPDVYDVLSEVFVLVPTNGPKITRIEPVDVRVGLIEGTEFHDQDIIFSFEALRYVFDQARALEKIINGLANEGVAILEVPVTFLEESLNIREYLESCGIHFEMGRIRVSVLGLLGKVEQQFIIIRENLIQL